MRSTSFMSAALTGAPSARPMSDRDPRGSVTDHLSRISSPHCVRSSFCDTLRPMKLFAVALALALPISGADPQLPHKVVQNWAQLPAGWNFGECSGVDVDKDDNVWIFNRGTHPVMQFDHNGKLV